MPSFLSRTAATEDAGMAQGPNQSSGGAPAYESANVSAHARSYSTPAPPTLSNYADWERETARDRRNRSRSNTQITARRSPPPSIIDEEETAGGDVLPPYSGAKPPRYAAANDKPRLQHTQSLPVAEAESYTQAGFPRELPARGSGGPQNTMSMGEVRRWDGRRPCKVGRDGRCQCGKQVMRPDVVENADSRRKEMFNMKGKTFWGMMGMSFASVVYDGVVCGAGHVGVGGRWRIFCIDRPPAEQQQELRSNTAIKAAPTASPAVDTQAKAADAAHARQEQQAAQHRRGDDDEGGSRDTNSDSAYIPARPEHPMQS